MRLNSEMIQSELTGLGRSDEKASWLLAERQDALDPVLAVDLEARRCLAVLVVDEEQRLLLARGQQPTVRHAHRRYGVDVRVGNENPIEQFHRVRTVVPIDEQASTVVARSNDGDARRVVRAMEANREKVIAEIVVEQLLFGVASKKDPRDQRSLLDGSVAVQEEEILGVARQREVPTASDARDQASGGA